MAGAPFRPPGQTQGGTQTRAGATGGSRQGTQAAQGPRRGGHGPCDGVATQHRNKRNANSGERYSGHPRSGICRTLRRVHRDINSKQPGRPVRAQGDRYAGRFCSFFVLAYAVRIVNANRPGIAYQTPVPPHKSAIVAAVHQSTGNWCHRAFHDGGVTALLCRAEIRWFIRGVHMKGATCRRRREPRRGNRLSPSEL